MIVEDQESSALLTLVSRTSSTTARNGWAERLGEIIARAEDEQALDLARGGIAAHDDDRNAGGDRIFLQMLNYVGPVDVRKVKVE